LSVQAIGLLAASTVWAIPIGVLALVARFLPGLSGAPQRLVVAALLYLAAYLLALNLWRRLFEPGKARFRVIGCSNVVATHYRRWGEAVITLSGVTLGIFLLCRALGTLELTRNYLLEVYKGVALLLVLLFARRRDLVLKVLGRAELTRHPQVYGMVVSIYPVVWLGLMSLIVLQVLGYGALTHYVVTNGLQTILVAGLALLLSRLIWEESEGLQKKVRAWGTAAAATGESRAAPDEEVEKLLGGAAAREWSLFIAVCSTLFRWTVGIGAAVWIARAWGLTRRQATDLLRIPLWGSRESATAVTVWRIAAAMGTLLLTIWLSRVARRALQTRIYPYHSSIDRGAQVAINTLLHYTLVVLGIYFGLRALHVDLGALLLLLGGLGLGLGLGLQPLIVNFISGVLMLFERHVRVGDSVIVDGELGEVTNVSMRSTTVRTPDGIHLVVPNGEFINKTVVNWTRGIIRGQVHVAVSYGVDPDKVKEILLSIGRRAPKALSEPEPTVWFRDFGESGLHFTLACWFANPADRWQSMIDMRYEITQAFRANGIEIPFPQRTITFDAGTPVAVRMVPDGAADGKTPRPDIRSTSPPGARSVSAVTDRTRDSEVSAPRRAESPK
jgi:small-conductance mechanosensitive channel